MHDTKMGKSPSIRAIFEQDSKGNYTEDALLYQYILRYCTKDETLNQLDEETKRTLLFQFKLEIEGYYDIYLSNKEWEIMRYRNITNYSSVTIPGFRSIDEIKIPYSPGTITTDCIKCGSYHSLIGRVMLASWDVLVRG